MKKLFSLLLLIGVLTGCQATISDMEQSPPPKRSLSFEKSVVLQKMEAHALEMTDVDGIKRKGIEYQVYLEIPNDQVMDKEKFSLHLTLSGTLATILQHMDDTSELRISETKNNATVYRARFASMYTESYTDADIEYSLALHDDEINLTLYYEGKKIKEIN